MMRLKRIVRFLAGKPGTTLIYELVDGMPRIIDVYVDSDWAKERSTRKSSSSIGVQIGGCAIKNMTKTQGVVALSSGEAELNAAVKGVALPR